MKITGRDAFTGEEIEIAFGRAIDNVDPVLEGQTSGMYVCSGFIDLQVNGFCGVDFNSSSTKADDCTLALKAMHATGVTRCFPTLITNSPEALTTQLKMLAQARASLPDGLCMEGFHVEGPHISSEDGPRGAHPKEFVRPPDIEEYKRWQEAVDGNVRLITIAPEWPGAARYIEDVTRDGVVASIGHTRASAEQVHDAVLAGATMSTHLGNGAGSKDRHDPFIEQQLTENRLTASFIVDGHHLPSEFLRRALEAKGVERSVLISDAVAPAMCAPGPYKLGAVDVDLRDDGRVTLRGKERLAGSSLRMDHAVGLVMQHAGISLAAALAMATRNAARAGRVAGRLRGIQPGERADLILFRIEDGRVAVQETYVSGERVFRKAG